MGFIGVGFHGLGAAAAGGAGDRDPVHLVEEGGEDLLLDAVALPVSGVDQGVWNWFVTFPFRLFLLNHYRFRQ